MSASDRPYGAAASTRRRGGGSPEHPTSYAPDFEAFFDVSLDLMVIRDGEGRMVRVNRAWEALLGYKREELEGELMLAFIHPDDAEASRMNMARIAKDFEVDGFINRYRRKDGGHVRLEWRARRAGAYVYGVARDVSERIALERDMAQAREAAEAANHAKSEFLANMSHEIRTPLNGVIGVAAALERTELSEEQRRMAELILTSGATLERVLSDILDISKIEAGRFEIELQTFDPIKELGGLLEVYRLRAAEKGLAFDVALGEAVRHAFIGDAVRLRQILGNLVSNAIKFTERGAVRTRIDVQDAADGASELLMEVSDTGIGFDSAFARDLFGRFRQADESITRRFGGTGLGLAICKSLLDLMGGTIAAESIPGVGSRFSATLPLRRAMEDAFAPVRPRLGEGGFEGLRILVAEDHPTNRQVVEMILRPLGVELTLACDGAEALRALDTESFDVILMDMQMPVLDGLSAVREIRQREAAHGRRTPIIMLSANAMRQHQLDSLKGGADLHVAKPATAAGLIEALAHVLSM
jgi:PAS domain S-box-containing protein